MAKTFLVLISAALLALSGCLATHRNPPAPAAPDCCPPTAVNRLAIVAYDQRIPIQLFSLDSPSAGRPFTAAENEDLRDLTLQQCETMAAQSSPIAEQFEAEKRILCRNPDTPNSVIQMLGLQAEYERNKSAGQAMQAYMNLVEVHLQHSLIGDSKSEIERVEQTVSRLRDAQVTVKLDDGEFVRRRLEIDEQEVRLGHQSHQLVAQLESLLSLADDSTKTIWTNYQSPLTSAEFNLDSELAVAMENRTDLAALDLLARSETSSEMLEWLRAAAGSSGPLMGIMARRIGLLSSHRSRGQDNCEAENRKCQVAQLAQNKRDSIEFEVTDAVDSIKTRLQVIDIKRQSIASLEQSLAAAEQGKDLQPVDLASDLEKRLQLIKLRSDLIHELVAIESDVVRLRQAQGLLGHSNDHTAVESMRTKGKSNQQSESAIERSVSQRARARKKISGSYTSLSFK